MGNCFKPPKPLKVDLEADTDSNCCYNINDSCPSSCCVINIIKARSQLKLTNEGEIIQ